MDGLNNLLIGIHCLFGWLVIILAIILVWGYVALLRTSRQVLDQEQQKQISRPLLISGFSGIVILIIAALFAYQNIASFFGAFPRP
jgi:hypothetical protein